MIIKIDQTRRPGACIQMVNIAVRSKDNTSVDASDVSRKEATSLHLTKEKYTCRGCEKRVFHKLGTHGKRKPHFAHEAGVTKDQCIYVGRDFIILHDGQEICDSSEFVQKWQSKQEQYVDTKNGIVYSLGDSEEKARIVVLGKPYDQRMLKFRFIEGIGPQIYILDAITHGVTIGYTEDNVPWITFNKKNGVNHVLEEGGWVAVDFGHLELYLITGKDCLPPAYTKDNTRKVVLGSEVLPNWFFRSESVSYTTFVEKYLPSAYHPEVGRRASSDKKKYFKNIQREETLKEKKEEEARKVASEARRKALIAKKALSVVYEAHLEKRRIAEEALQEARREAQRIANEAWINTEIERRIEYERREIERQRAAEQSEVIAREREQVERDAMLERKRQDRLVEEAKKAEAETKKREIEEESTQAPRKCRACGVEFTKSDFRENNCCSYGCLCKPLLST